MKQKMDTFSICYLQILSSFEETKDQRKSDWVWPFFNNALWKMLLGTSATRLGEFWNFQVTNFNTKVSHIFGDFLSYFEKSHILRKTTVVTLGANLGKIWLLLIPTSCHAAWNDPGTKKRPLKSDFKQAKSFAPVIYLPSVKRFCR